MITKLQAIAHLKELSKLVKCADDAESVKLLKEYINN